MVIVSNPSNSRPKARDVLLTWARARGYEARAGEYLELAGVAPTDNIRNRFVTIAEHYRSLAQLERSAADETASPGHQSQETIVRRSRRFASFTLVLLTLIFTSTTLLLFDFARADNCLTAPNSSAPKGSHWYYHLNRATQQKCWYVRSSDKEAPYPTVQATSANGAMPSPSAKQISSTGANDGSVHKLEASIAALQDPASNTIPNGSPSQSNPPENRQALRESALSDGKHQPTVATMVVWPDPPQIAQVPSVNAGEAIATAESNNHANVVSDTTESVARNREQISKFEIPIAVFPTLAIGLVVIGFGVHFVMKNSNGRGAQTIDDPKAVPIIPDDDHIKLARSRPADESSSFGEDDFRLFVSAVSGRAPLERTIGSVYAASEASAREARLAQLFDDIHQHLGWDGAKRQLPKQKAVS